MTNSHFCKKGLFHLIGYDPHQGKPRQEGSQGGNLEAGTEAKAMEGMSYWLTPCVLFSLLSYAT